ncbi:MAG: ribosome biogenesis GTPase Der [Rhodospirillaceae bacterium]|nr:ribosome biogenesis GTPase Der [Rhodospirillaceae bacterium]
MSRKPRLQAAETEPTFTVAIVGRPNVGKSTLFNRLVGRRSAIVHDRPGVTRDRKEGFATLGDLNFRVFDTAGLEDATDDSLEGRMRRLTLKSVADADVALLLIDAKAGIVPTDEHFADLLRQQKTPVILVANKCESRDSLSGLYDAFRLGLGDPIDISAEHGQGLESIYRAISGYAPPEAFEQRADDDGYDDAEPAPDISPDDLPERPLNIAIVGRPNVGKSTLINRLIGEERQLTGPEAGITRDAVMIPFVYGDRKLRLVDTAGVRKRPNITDAVEKISVGETFEALRMADVVVIVVDATVGMDKQDLTLARYVEEEGRAIVLALNKWDLVEEKDKVLQAIEYKLETSLAQLPGLEVITLSAQTGLRIDNLMDAVFRVHKLWSRHIPTSALNRWLEATMAHHPPPLSIHKQRIKLRYMTQVKTRPPEFLFFSTRADDLPESYMRYLANEMRDAFDLHGIPIRLSLRKPKNPFIDENDNNRARFRKTPPKPSKFQGAVTQKRDPDAPRETPQQREAKQKALETHQKAQKARREEQKKKRAKLPPKPRSLKARAKKANKGKKVKIPRRGWRG